VCHSRRFRLLRFMAFLSNFVYTHISVYIYIYMRPQRACRSARNIGLFCRNIWLFPVEEPKGRSTSRACRFSCRILYTHIYMCLYMFKYVYIHMLPRNHIQHSFVFLSLSLSLSLTLATHRPSTTEI